MSKQPPARKPKAGDGEAAATLTPFPLLRRTSPKGPVVAGKRQMGRENTEQMRAQMNRELLQLDHYADGGDAEAVELLATVANAAIQMLRVLAERQPELLRPFARKCAVWPDFIGKHPGAAKWNKWLLDELQVGAESPDRGGWREYSPASQQALFLRDWLLQNQLALELPELTDGTQKHWFEVGWSFILTATNGRPDEDEFLAPIGRSAIGKNSTKRGMSEQTAGMKRDDVIAKIKELLAKPFLTLTRHFPTKHTPLCGEVPLRDT